MGPRERYQRDLQRPDFVSDPDQSAVVDVLERIHSNLLESSPVRPGWLPRRRQPAYGIPGLYLWGGVGRGKTYLVDNFFDGLPFTQKKRLHYQRLMQHVHALLTNLPRHPDPLPDVARHFAQGCKVLCIDEFHVDDVGDAMLLAGLLRAWLELGITLFFTSNTSPDALYLNGLQRERFLPAIKLIQAHTTVMCLGGSRDFRFTQDRELPYFSCGVGPHCDKWMGMNFQRIVGDAARYDIQLEVNDRSIRVRGCAPGVAWFDFQELCATARSALDYLKLCDQFQEIFIGNIVPTNDETADIAARFIQLIDAIYDHGIRLWASSTAKIDTLYSGQTLAFDFQRTHSRFQKLLGPR